jgi:hypothetical protein
VKRFFLEDPRFVAASENPTEQGSSYRYLLSELLFIHTFFAFNFLEPEIKEFSPKKIKYFLKTLCKSYNFGRIQ